MTVSEDKETREVKSPTSRDGMRLACTGHCTALCTDGPDQKFSSVGTVKCTLHDCTVGTDETASDDGMRGSGNSGLHGMYGSAC